MKLAIVSDLHCMYDPECLSKETFLFSNGLRDVANRHPVAALLSLIEREQLTSDCMICPGDISNKVDIQGLISGFGFLQEIKEALHASDLFCTPGNHDVDYKHAKATVIPSADHVIKNLHKEYPVTDSSLKQQLWAQNFCIFSNDKIVLLIYNSVFNYTDESTAKKTQITPACIEQIKTKIQDIDATGKVKVAVMHHHPTKYSNTHYCKYPDCDTITNGDTFLDALQNLGFNLVIHGHKHIPRLETKNKMPIFCAGSFSSLENLNNLYRNSFHIIDLNIDNTTNNCLGKITTWNYSFDLGWRKSQDPNSIFPTITGFGCTKSITDLVDAIMDVLNSNPYKRILFSKLASNVPEIEFLTPIEQYDLEKKLSAQNVEFRPCLTVGPDEIATKIKAEVL